MDELAIYNKEKDGKKHIYIIKKTDDDYYLERKGKNITIGSTENLINYINYNTNGLTWIQFNNFNRDELSNIIFELLENNEVQDTIFGDTYFISKKKPKTRVIKNDQMDERTRRSDT